MEVVFMRVTGDILQALGALPRGRRRSGLHGPRVDERAEVGHQPMHLHLQYRPFRGQRRDVACARRFL